MSQVRALPLLPFSHRDDPDAPQPVPFVAVLPRTFARAGGNAMGQQSAQPLAGDGAVANPQRRNPRQPQRDDQSRTLVRRTSSRGGGEARGRAGERRRPEAALARAAPAPGIGPDEPVAYRHVRLRCGDHVLSEADNWYVPSRLTPE